MDEVATGVLHGSLVWQVDTVRDYEPFAARFAAAAAKRGEAVVYFHFESVAEMQLGERHHGRRTKRALRHSSTLLDYQRPGRFRSLSL